MFVTDPGYMSRTILKFRTEKFDTCTNGNFYSGNSCKRLVPSNLHELLEQRFPFVTRIESGSLRLTLSNILLMYLGH